MWSTIKAIPKFTPRSQVDRILGIPQRRLEDRPAFYCGGGFVLTYAPRRFRVEGLQRVESGEPGEYAVSVLHFSDGAALQSHLGLEAPVADDAAPLVESLTGGISYRTTLAQARRWARANAPEGWGEIWRMAGGRLQILYHFLNCGLYRFFFYGKDPNAALTGFQFELPE